MANSTRIVGEHRPDFHSLQSFVESPLFSDKSGEELVLALYNYLTSTVHGTYHFWPLHEAEPRIRRQVTDGSKMLNCYGWMICGQCANLLYQLYNFLGLKARLHGVPGHVLCEVFYDKRWHHLDVDMWNWFRTPEGHIASAGELSADAENLIVHNCNKSEPCNLPDRDLVDYARMYANAEISDSQGAHKLPDWSCTAHSLDFVLRPGESLIRSSINQERFVFPPEWIECTEVHAKEWHGCPRERYEPFRTLGNGRLRYAPRLASSYEDFAEGVWEYHGVSQSEEGLKGEGDASFRIQSPYVFCAREQLDGEAIITTDGVWLQIAGEGEVRAEITDAEGEWLIVAETAGSFNEKIDISAFMSGRYETFIRFTPGAEAILYSFAFDGFIMTAPASLPLLAQGENRMHVRHNDRKDIPTVPWSEIIDFRAGVELGVAAQKIENGIAEPYMEGWQQLLPVGDGEVEAVYRFNAPLDYSFAWFYCMAQMREPLISDEPKTAEIFYSLDGTEWQSLTGAELPVTENHWDTNLQKDSPVLPAGTKSVWIRITSDTAITAVEFYGHLDCRNKKAHQAQITHRWIDAEGEKEFIVPSEATEYTVICGDAPDRHEIEMSVPHHA